MPAASRQRWGRSLPTALLAASTALTTVSWLATAASASAAAPTVTGPITGGLRGRPFTSATFDLEAYGYVEEEYFLEGTATTYGPAPGTELGSDGMWNVIPTGNLPYKTRILVRRPADAKRFNGTVVVEWQNVSGGFDIDAAWLKFYQEILREGYAWVGVSAQRAGVHPPPLIPGLSQPLLVWDPLRYGTLSVPNDDTSYDIFSQAGQAVGPDRPSLSNDPMGGLPVVQAIAAGQSQSGSRMATYVNGVHLLAEVFDGFLVMSRSAGSARLAAAVPLPSAVLIRTDLDVPVLALNTETEGVGYFPARQPDTESFRYWEVAGSAHQTAFDNDILAVQFLRDLGVTLVENCDNPVNDLPFHYVANAALSSMDAWARGGPPAASLPRIAVSGSPLAIERDALGNALGGIRLPQLEVPVAQYGGIGTPLATCRLQGFVIAFSAETLAELYRNHGHYASSFAHATRGAEDAGFLLHQDAQEGIGAASHAAVP